MPGQPAGWRHTLTIRPPRALVEAAKAEAARRGVSLTALIEAAVAHDIGRPELLHQTARTTD